MPETTPTVLGLAVALGIGLLIGVERERNKGRGRLRGQAGVRSFTIVALTGALSQLSGEPWLVAAAALFVGGLALLSYRRTAAGDPGITTELALFATYVLGVMAVERPQLAAAAGVVVALLLAGRRRLHRFSTRVLTEGEGRSILQLAAAALIVLPLIPDRPLPWLAEVNPRNLWRLAVILMTLQAAGHVAVRMTGAWLGLALSGLASGFVSSTATFAAMGARARAEPALRASCVAGALFSNVATIAQLTVLAVAVQPALLAALWPMLLAGGVAAAAGAAAGLHRRRDTEAHAQPASNRMFSLRQAVMVAALLTGVTAGVALVQNTLGAGAATIATALAGFADVHSAAASAYSLAARGRLPMEQMLLAVLLAFSANSLSKFVAAWVAGGAGFAMRVLPGLALLAAAVWGASLWRLSAVA
jgi:uncharacterized membrane protein (DUF4010 family)